MADASEMSSNMRARQIVDSDLEDVVDLLTTGFGPSRTRQYWRTGLGRLAVRPNPTGTPRYGYLLERSGVALGVILLLHSRIRADGAWVTRCNLSSWYVAPELRASG